MISIGSVLQEEPTNDTTIGRNAGICRNTGRSSAREGQLPVVVAISEYNSFAR
jgi:hypothetical protein